MPRGIGRSCRQARQLLHIAVMCGCCTEDDWGEGVSICIAAFQLISADIFMFVQFIVPHVRERGLITLTDSYVQLNNSVNDTKLNVRLLNPKWWLN